MKNLILLLVLSACASSVLAQTPPPAPPTPPPSPRMETSEEIYKVVEEQPLFPGCEGYQDLEEAKKCAGERMVEFIYSNLEFPSIARTSGIQGTVYIKFIVEKDGRISNPEIVRDIGGGCGEEAIRVVNLLPDFNPGKQRGVPVRVQYNLPVKFKLN